MDERPKKNAGDSQMFLAEIVGEEGLQGQRMQAGAILDLMDVLAGQIAVRHSASPVVTVSFDRVDLTYPIYHQDLIRLEGQLAAVGKSSMIVRLEGFRMDGPERELIPIQSSFVTMVAIDESLRPNPDIPGLNFATPQEEALRDEALAFKARSMEMQRIQEESSRPGSLNAAGVEDPINREKQDFVPPAKTEIQLKRSFLPRNNNVLGTIFGGDILLWMDRLATYTARQFTGNRNMVTLAMNNIFFKHPIYTTDIVEMTARVVYVRHYTLEVEIVVSLQRLSGEEVQSHSGNFTVLNYDEAGDKRPINTGLLLEDEDQSSLRRYQQAKERYHRWKEHSRK